jgi:hypothetical protein
MRPRQTGTSAAGVTLVSLLVLSAPAPAHGQDARPADRKVSLPGVEKDLPYADGGDHWMLDVYLPDKEGFTTVVFTYGGGWHSGGRKSGHPDRREVTKPRLRLRVAQPSPGARA